MGIFDGDVNSAFNQIHTLDLAPELGFQIWRVEPNPIPYYYYYYF